MKMFILGATIGSIVGSLLGVMLMCLVTITKGGDE